MGFSWGNWARRFWTRSVTRPARQRRNWNPVAALEVRTLLAATLTHSVFPGIGSSQTEFGSAVATDGNFLVVGAYGDSTGAFRSGQAFVFNATTGALVATLANPTPGVFESFGSSVSISGNTVVVGAYRDNTGGQGSGQAYVFNATTGALVATLANPTPASSDFFGYAVSVSGNTVVVSAAGDDTDGPDSGQAYLFNATTGALMATLANPTPASGDFFGTALSMSENTVVVGAYDDDMDGTDSGQAYVFNATTGALLATLANPTPASGDSFGYSVAVSGNAVVVSATGDDTGGTDSGQAYVFNATTGALMATLLNPTPASGDFFGYAVAVSGNTVVVSASDDDTGGTESGQAYLFNATTGALMATLPNPTPASGDFFGYSVAVSGDTVAVGAVSDNTFGQVNGAAYLFLFQNDPPIISSGGAFSVLENTTLVTASVATDPELDTLTFAISGGVDAGLFTINPSTGLLAFALAPDYESPQDANGDNVYELTVSVSDGVNPSVTQTITVTVTTPVSLSAMLDGSGNLVITDTDATGKNNSLTISNDGSGNIVVTDAIYEFADNGGIAGAVLSNGNRTLTVPVTSITGTTVIVNSALGNDSLNAALAASLGKILDFNGGTGGSDSLTLGGGSTTTVTHALNNVSDGSVTLAGVIAGTINYTGLEPVTDLLSATNRVFTFNGGSETISLTDGNAGDGRMTIESNPNRSVNFTSPSGSLTINAGTGADVVSLSSVDAAFNASLTINGGTGNDTINLNTDMTFASGNNLDVDLQNDDVAPGIDTISVFPNANLSLSGSGAATLKASKNISLFSGSSITTVDGGITFSANSAGVATLDSGIRLNGATIQATGTGHVGLVGHGGGASTATHQHGVLVQGGGQVLSSGGNLTIVGYGGLGGIANRGVTVAGTGSRIATVDGAISVTGTAGAWSGVGDGRFQEGVKVEFGAAIEATANGSVTIVGVGGSAGGQYNRGINIESSGSRVSVVDGNLSLTGNAGATNSMYNDGVLVWTGGIVRSSGAGNIVLAGTGGGNNALAGFNRGVLIDGTLEATGTGSITMTGTGGVGSESFGIYVGTGYSATTINQPITLAADSI